MSLDDPKTVDAIGIERNSNKVSLVITDSWDWKDEKAHLSALSEKINAYLGFVESGELIGSYPDAHNRGVEILIVGLWNLNERGLDLISQASTVAQQYGVSLRFEHRPAVV